MKKKFSKTMIKKGIPRNGLIGYWPFNGDADDKSGSGNDGIVTGAILTTNRNNNPDSSYWFDGDDDIINCGPGGNVDYITLGGWIRPEAFPGSGRHIISKFIGSWGVRLSGVTPAPIRIFLAITPGNLLYTFTDTTFADDEWNHFAVTYDGSIARAYKNGVESSQTSSMAGVIDNTSIDFSIAQPTNPADADDRQFKGKIDDLVLYNRALSQTEIIQLYKAY